MPFSWFPTPVLYYRSGMSGHSKWSKVKHQKAVTDLRKGKVFSQLARQITLAVREGKSGIPSENPRLRMVLEKAREADLPKDNVQRAIDRGLGKGTAGTLQDVTVEGYGPSGVAILVLALTDNPNRTKSEIRSIFERHKGSTGEPGSVSYVFSTPDGNASYRIPVTQAQDADQVRRLLDALEEQEDVVSLSHNADL